jgi:sialidase-1
MKLTWLLSVLILLGGRSAASEPDVTDVFIPKSDGFKSIRIPSLVVSRKGTLLAFAEGRAANADQAKNKLILKWSADGGRTWDCLLLSPMVVCFL